MQNRFLFLCVVTTSGLTGLALLFSFLAPWLPLADSVAHFRFQLVVFVLATAVVLMLARAWAWVLAAALMGFIGLAGLGPALTAPTDRAADSPTITLLQLNLSFRNRSPEAVVELIRRRKPDLVTFQELTSRLDTIRAALATDYPHQVRCRFAAVGAVAVLSRLPPAGAQARGCVERRGLAWLRVNAGGRALSVAAIHLHWPYPFDQADQITRIEQTLGAIPRPVLLAGDFNAAPWSHAVRRIAAATGTRVAGGLRFTFPHDLAARLPWLALPLDHVLLPPQFTVRGIQPGPYVGSDHLPVIAVLGAKAP